MNKLICLIVFWFLVAAMTISAAAQSADQTPERINEVIADSDTQIAKLESGEYPYRAFIKRTRIEDRHDVYPPADVVSFSYEADAAPSEEQRPVLFLFNGGPGSSSIWLHMTGFGPTKVSAELATSRDGETVLEQEDNLGFLIDVADLVFVDPVGTGLSRVVASGEETAFRDLRVDARAMCRFVENWLAAEDRTDAPVYVVGVSYSTLRAAGMASHSMCRDFRKTLHGLIFVSGLLDLRMRHPNDATGRLSRYPSIAAVAWYRGLIDQSDWPGGMDAFLTEMEDYADTVLGPALINRHRLTADETRAIIDDLHTQLGLSPPGEQIRSLGAAIRNAQSQVDGRRTACGYDARFDCGRAFGPHPDLPLSRFGDTLEQNLVEHLSAMTGYALQTDDYNVMRGNRFRANWDYRFEKSQDVGKGTDMAQILLRKIKPPQPVPTAADIQTMSEYLHRLGRAALSQQATTRIMVASGVYDLVTPYYAMELALLRAGLEPSQFTMHLYEGGHMMYLEKETGYQLAADIRSFIRSGERLN